MSTYGPDAETLSTLFRLQKDNAARLPAHNPEATCPKCGADAGRVMVEYHACAPEPFIIPAPRPGMKCTGKFLGEHLCRTCGRCGHCWQEHTVG